MRYRVKAFDKSKQGGASISQIDIEARSADEAAAAVVAKGFAPLSITAAAPWGAALLQPRFTHASALLFCQELLALLDAGMGLTEALDILQGKARDPLARQVLSSVNERVREGRTFSEALEQAQSGAAQPPFPTLLVATIRSAERTGQLPQALRRYLAYQGELTAVRDKVVTACEDSRSNSNS